MRVSLVAGVFSGVIAVGTSGASCALPGGLSGSGVADAGSTSPQPTSQSGLPTERPVAPTKPAVAPEATTVRLALTAKDAEADRTSREAELRRRLVPAPFDGANLDRIPEALGFDESARKRFAEARAYYDAAQTDARREDPRLLETLIPAAFRFDPVAKEIVPVHTPELLAAMRIRDQMLVKLLEAEVQLDKTINDLCPLDGRRAWRAFRHERAQELYGHAARLPGASVNLLELVPKVGLTDIEIAALEPFFESYSRDYLNELRLRNQRLLEIERESAENLVTLGPEWRAGRTESEALEVDRGLAQLEVGHTLADIGLRGLNDRAIVALKSQLLPASWRKVIEAYRRVVHPELYEDERSFRLLAEEMLGLPALEATTIGGIVETLAVLDERLRPLGQQAAELADGIIAAEALAASDAAAARILVQSKLQTVLEKRRRAVRESVQLLRGMVPGTEPRFALKLDDAMQTLAALDRAGRFIKDGLDARAAELAVLQAIGDTPAEAAHEPAHGLGAPEPQTQPVGTSESAAPTPPRESERMPERSTNGRGSRGSRSR